VELCQGEQVVIVIWLLPGFSFSFDLVAIVIVMHLPFALLELTPGSMSKGRGLAAFDIGARGVLCWRKKEGAHLTSD